MPTVLLADDHNLVREGIRSLLERIPDVLVVGEAVDGEKALSQCVALHPDILILDIAMPKMTGIQVIQKLKEYNCDTRVIILSMYIAPELIKQSIDAGAKAYTSKQSVSTDLSNAIQHVMRGDLYLSPALGISREILAHEPIDDALSPREQQILQAIAQGHTSTQIAKILYLSPKTVEKYRTSLMSKLDVQNVAELVHLATTRGLILPDNPQ